MRRALAALTLLFAFLLCFAGTASAYVDVGSKNRVGGFGDPFGDYAGFDGLQALDTHQEITILCYDPATGVVFYVRQNPWTFFDPLGLMSEHETKWQGRAQDERRGFLSRAGAAFMSAAEGLNVFRADSSIRQGGRQLDAGLAEGRANLKKNAPPVVREIGQVALGVGKTGSFGMNAAGLAEFGETASQQGAVETGKNVVTGLASGLKNDPVETLSSFATPSALGKAVFGKTARGVAEANSLAGFKSGQGFSGVFDPTTGSVHFRPSSYANKLPEGWVPAKGGHVDVLLESGFDAGAAQGFTAFLQKNGDLSVQWKSGLNDGPGSLLPKEKRPPVLDALSKETGRKATSDE